MVSRESQANALEVAHSMFYGAALLSGLMTQEQLDEVVRAAGADTAGPPLPLEQIDDAKLAKHAVELNFITRYQAEQLKRGRNVFNLGEYLILEDIGKGGMGHVFKAEHAMLGRIEAIKVLPQEKSTPEAIARFQHEIRAHAKLDHPNLARLTYAGRTASRWYFVTEYVPGSDLRKLVRHSGRLTMQEAATIISQAAQGLSHAHSRGLIHRDIKPGNLLVTPEGITKVIDMGLSGFMTSAEDGGKRLGQTTVGTPDYIAPETIFQGEVTPASDIYSLGCTLYYAVTGKVPFPGGTSVEKFQKHRNPTELPINPQLFNPDLSPEFLEVLGDMMEKDSKKRIRTAAEVVRRMAPWTLEVVPNAGFVDSNANLNTTRAAAQSLRAVHAGPIDSDALLPEISGLSPAARDSIILALQQTTPITGPAHDTLRIETQEDTVRLPLGLYIYPSSMLGPVLLVVASIITVMVLLIVFL